MSCDWRRSLITHPDAISFLRILGERVFQQPLAIALTIPVLSAAIYDFAFGKRTLRLTGNRGQLPEYGANRNGVTSSRARTDGKG